MPDRRKDDQRFEPKLVRYHWLHLETNARGSGTFEPVAAMKLTRAQMLEMVNKWNRLSGAHDNPKWLYWLNDDEDTI